MFLAGCAGISPKDVEFSIRNSTQEPLVINVGNSIFSTSITLAPGQRWSGHLDPRLVASGWVEIRPLLAPR
jgi:hypothetical protein